MSKIRQQKFKQSGETALAIIQTTTKGKEIGKLSKYELLRTGAIYKIIAENAEGLKLNKEEGINNYKLVLEALKNK